MQEYPRYLYRAPFVVTGTGPVLVDGAVLTEEGVVAAVGPFAELRGADAKLEEYDGHVIVPGLVNGHAHLELSHLADLSREGQGTPPANMTVWIRELLAARALAQDEAENDLAARLALARLYAGGCRAVLDIGNLPESRFIGEDFKTQVYFHLELFGLSGEVEQAALDSLRAQPADICCTAHAPYSSGPALIRAAKERARGQGAPFPIHVAESAAEDAFLRTGGGPFADFLQEKGLMGDAFAVPGCGAVSYLDALGVLDAKTLCVHGVHVSDAEIAILARRGAAVCLCPGSNRFLGVGTAPLARYLAAGVPLLLGTDSLASNPELSLWREMQLLRQEHPEVDPAAVFAMATENGGRFLGLGHRLGVIAPGVGASSLLAVRCAAQSVEAMFAKLTTVGSEVRLEWLE